jgi:L-lactate dehydrogenase complex protein LldE
MDQLYPNTALNMIKVLEKTGCTVQYNANQTCCGQPAYNAGFRSEAKEVCTKFIKDFDGTGMIVVPSASCAGFLINYYPSIFNDSVYSKAVKNLQNRVVEFSDFLVNHLKIEDLGATLHQKATYHDSCAALREYKLKDEPRILLSNVKGLELTEMEDRETCCGFGGTFAVKFEAISTAMADQKLAHARATGANLVISTDISCLMHIDGYAQNKEAGIQTMHLADVLASGW